MPHLQFVPWRQIASWRCTACGDCCKDYSVVLNFTEWLTIAQIFGAENVVRGLDKIFLRRLVDGRCAFLCQLVGTSLCGLQNMKPDACKLWPFKVLTEPRYGEPNQAVFNYAGKKLYVYADSNCAGLRYGDPAWDFSAVTLKEFADIALGNCKMQKNSTRSANGYYARRF
jgi:Fe-S-cluster containining protein